MNKASQCNAQAEETRENREEANKAGTHSALHFIQSCLAVLRCLHNEASVLQLDFHELAQRAAVIRHENTPPASNGVAQTSHSCVHTHIRHCDIRIGSIPVDALDEAEQELAGPIVLKIGRTMIREVTGRRSAGGLQSRDGRGNTSAAPGTSWAVAVCPTTC